MNLIKRFWFPGALVVLCLIIVLIIWNPFASSSSLRVIGEAPDFELENTLGKTVTLDNTNGKVRLVYFFFSYCPDVCPPTTAVLSKLQTELKDRKIFANKTEILSVTFDPTRDTTERLIDFSSNYYADYTGWSFLRGEEDYTMALAKKFMVSVIKDNKGNFFHQNMFVLVDGKGQIRSIYDANDLEITVEEIASDMESLL